MLLLAHNQTGYLNLLQIASTAQLEGYYYKPRIDRPFLAQHAAGLIGTTGCMAAEIPQAILNNQPKLAQELMGQYLDIFGKDRFFIELQEHHIPALTDINKKLIEMAPHFGLENNFLATNDVHYSRAEDAIPHDILLCIQTGATVQAQKRLRFSDQEYYIKSHDEMAALFGHIPGALSNSLLIAEMCEIDLDPKGYHLPEFEVPAGETAQTYLRKLCELGLDWRYGAARNHDEVLNARLEHELSIIGSMGFETYFLIVWDLCQWAARSDEWWQTYQDPYPYDSYEAWQSNDIWWNVRGSGAASIVAYALGITSIDPITNGLIFERFLNPGRVSMPDIDLDYPDDVRSQMVAYTKRRYGEEKVAQIITFGTLGARAAIRDVGRAFDMPLPEVDALARMVPAIPGKPAKIDNVLDANHEFYSAELSERYKRETAVKNLLDTAKSVEGISRHASSHAAGVIISDRPLHEYVPLNRPTSGEAGLGGVDRVTQWPMEVVESIGLLKIDFLGLSTLTVMRRAARLIEERSKVSYTMDNIPYDEGHAGPDPTKDPSALFDMLGRGEVAGVFQVEGAGMRRLMMEMKPRRFDHIIAAISLYRPGPMENIPEYIRRMHSSIYDDKDIVEYHTEALKPILKDTYGILVYQEQIIRIASDLAGYEPGEADMIRKAVSKKKKKLMDEHQAKFTDGAMARGFSREVCEAIWGDIEFFARYGFNKAHAADYAKVTCQTAFLKAHYPVEYLAAMLSVERDNSDKVRRYFAEAKSLGIDVAAPDVNRSGLDFTIEDDGERPLIRFGLGAIKNAGAAALSLITNNRDEAGPFENLQDLCDRVDMRRVGKRALEFMIKGRVFDAWGTPNQFLEAMERIVNYSTTTHSAAAAGQMSLFGSSTAVPMEADLLQDESKIPVVAHQVILEWEKEALGVHVSEHPLERPLILLKEQTNVTIGDIDENWHGKSVRLAGMIGSLRPLTTKKGDPMAFGTLEDLNDKIDLVFFPRTWKEARLEVKVDQVLLVRGKVQHKPEQHQISILVDAVSTRFEAPAAANAPQKSSQPTSQTNGFIKKNGHSDPPKKEESGGKRKEPVLETAVTRKQPHATRSEAAPSLSKSSTPPPPPNFDEEMLLASTPAVGPEPETAVAEAKNESATAVAPSPNPTPQYGSPRLIIEIKQVSNWRDICRRAIDCASQYEGSDPLVLKVDNLPYIIELPNQKTHICPELMERLRMISGIRKVSQKMNPSRDSGNGL